MYDINLLTAFLTGLLTFFAPCTFVMLPGFLSYLTFVATGEGLEQKGVKFRLKIIVSALSYIAGFLTVFVILGMTATGIGRILRSNSDFFQIIGALFMISFGLIILFGERLKSFQFLFQEKKITFRPANAGKGLGYPFVIGLTSAFAWTPCTGPILGGILFLAGSSTQTVLQGGLLLFVFGLGITLPFLLMAIFVGYAQRFVKRFKRYTPLIHKVSAILLIFVGVLLLTGWYDRVFGALFQLFIKLGYTPI